MLEFWLDPESSYYKANKIKDLKKMVLFCALGCVENKPSTARACKGLIMNKCAVEGLFSASILSILLAPEEIFSKAEANARGFLHILAPI